MNIFEKLTSSLVIVAAICATVSTVGWFGVFTTEKCLIKVTEIRLTSIQVCFNDLKYEDKYNQQPHSQCWLIAHKTQPLAKLAV